MSPIEGSQVTRQQRLNDAVCRSESEASQIDAAGWVLEYDRVRQTTLEIVAPLEIEDYVVQTAPFMSPPRWHIGHTTWFFEMLLSEYEPGYRTYSQDYLFYFNSYYERFGTRVRRDQRGTRSRPTVRATLEYRSNIDERMRRLIGNLGGHRAAPEILRLLRLGLEHEMQHQELLVYDVKHLLGDLYAPPDRVDPPATAAVSGMAEVGGGLFDLGYAPGAGDGFAFDNEKPAHRVYVQDFAIARAPVTNQEYLEFVDDGGYRDYRWWFSEGWAAVHEDHWHAPMYWEQKDGHWFVRDFGRCVPVKDVAALPVSHVSYYEAAAFAKWAGKRLPTEAEWEMAACLDPVSGMKLGFPWGDQPAGKQHANLWDNRIWSVSAVGSFPLGQSRHGCHQMIGDVWEWTSSDYVPYPGFVSEFDEYNDKWFVGQKVLRGGSFATPRSHIRPTYRNFFGPRDKWMVAGIRLADTIG